MPRPKGSKNKKLAEWTLYPRKNPEGTKAHFATAATTAAVLADFKQTRGLLGYDAIYAKYAALYKKGYFCESGFNPLWIRILKRIKKEHGDSQYIEHYHKQKRAATAAKREARIAALRADKPYRRKLKGQPE